MSPNWLLEKTNFLQMSLSPVENVEDTTQRAGTPTVLASPNMENMSPREMQKFLTETASLLRYLYGNRTIPSRTIADIEAKFPAIFIILEHMRITL